MEGCGQRPVSGDKTPAIEVFSSRLTSAAKAATAAARTVKSAWPKIRLLETCEMYNFRSSTSPLSATCASSRNAGASSPASDDDSASVMSCRVMAGPPAATTPSAGGSGGAGAAGE